MALITPEPARIPATPEPAVPEDNLHTGLLEENEAVEKLQVSRFSWTIKNFSSQTNEKIYSDTFVVDGYKWRVLLFPKGNTEKSKLNNMSMYLDVPSSSALPHGWSQHAEFSLSVVNQKNNKLTIKQATKHMFNANQSDWGFTTFMPLRDLYNPSGGFLLNDTCIIEMGLVVREIEVSRKRKKDNTSSKNQTRSIKYGENLVGSRLKVWWPKEITYYYGIIESFDCISKNHKILYDDGDEELLDLKKEKWELLENMSILDFLKQPLPEKVSSPQSDIICVQGYKVKNNIAPLLEAIFKKHGDIVANCVFKPASMRSSFLEVVCEVVGRIQTTDFTAIVSEMEEVENQVSALEVAKVNVSWLRAHLEAIHKRKKAKKNSILLMETKGTTVLVKKAAQMDMKERLAELVDAQERVRKAERCVSVLDLVDKKLSNNISELKADKDSWVDQPIF